MKLSELLKNISIKNFPSFQNLESLNNIEINNIQFDSRKIEKGDLFVATRGTAVDGHDFIEKAIEKGAVAIIIDNGQWIMDNEKMLQEKLSIINYQLSIIQVENSLETLGILAANFYGNPTEKLRLVGVTGTNGKTTTATLLYEIFRKLGYKAGLISTVCNYIDGSPRPTEMTTPDPLILNQLFAEMVEIGCQYAFMEVSSHAIEQQRIAGLRFAGSIFTNLTQDHLDYHKTMDAYRDVKKRFFDSLPKNAFALTNLDDKNGEFMLQNTKAQKYTYSLRTLADFKTKILEHDFSGMLLEMNGTEVNVLFVGKFNAYNLTAVFGAATLLEQSAKRKEQRQGLALQSPENWLETTTAGSPFIIMEEPDLPNWNSINNYEKICSIQDYTGIININNKNILVFGDESMPLKIINNNDEIIIIRWLYAPDNVTVDNIIKELDIKTLPIIEHISINWNSNDLILFDSIKNYEEIQKEHIKISIKDKNCDIKTVEYKKNNVHLIIHTLAGASLQPVPENDNFQFSIFNFQLLTLISDLHSVSGRFETIRANGITAIVDYAHTPDALENVISTINDILQPHPLPPYPQGENESTNAEYLYNTKVPHKGDFGGCHLITVVGCGGNRDKTKRPIMARAAVNGSWKAILTSDNPRNEEPQDILNDMIAGLDNEQRRKSLTIIDRREAIKTAVALAQKGDVVLIAGKGHEDYQIVKGVKHHFDDREEVKQQLGIKN